MIKLSLAGYRDYRKLSALSLATVLGVLLCVFLHTLVIVPEQPLGITLTLPPSLFDSRLPFRAKSHPE